MRGAIWMVPTMLLASMCAAQISADSISGNAGIGSATINLTGAETLRATANSPGYYSFRGLRPGNYIVTPSSSGYTFKPVSQTVLLGNGNNAASASFVATAISVTETGLAISPATASFSAAGATKQLEVDATYSNESSLNVTGGATYVSNNTSVATVTQDGLVTAVASGSATIVASYGKMAASMEITVTVAGVAHSISGSAGAASVKLTLSGALSAAVTSASSGAYSFGGLPPGNYTVTPSLTGYTFSPDSRPASIGNVDLSGIDFNAIATQHAVDLSWSASTIGNPVSGQVVVGYNVYRSLVSGGPYTELNSSPITELTYDDKAVSSGQTWYYVCSAVDNLGNVSVYSNQAAATVP